MLHYGGAHLVIKLLHLRLRVTGLFLSTHIITYLAIAVEKIPSRLTVRTTHG